LIRSMESIIMARGLRVSRLLALRPPGDLPK